MIETCVGDLSTDRGETQSKQRASARKSSSAGRKEDVLVDVMIYLACWLVGAVSGQLIRFLPKRDRFGMRQVGLMAFIGLGCMLSLNVMFLDFDDAAKVASWSRDVTGTYGTLFGFYFGSLHVFEAMVKSKNSSSQQERKS